MVSIPRVTTLYMFTACTLFFVWGIATGGDNVAVPPSQSHDKKAVARWLDRAEQYAASLPEPQLVEVFPTLCEPMAAANKDQHIDRLLATIKDPKRRADQGLMICAALAAKGKCDVAIRRAKALPTERRIDSSGKPQNSWRNGGLYMVALFQSWAYDFASAKKTIGLIDDPETVSAAYEQLAESQAKAGLYAEAEESLKRFAATNEDGKKLRQEAQQLIARYKAAGQKDPPREISGTYLEGLRRVSTIFGDSEIKLNSLAEARKAEQAADGLEGPVDKANAWRQIAWAYYDMRGKDKKNLDRCRRAIEKSVQIAQKIPEGLGKSYMRAVAFASAANLYLDLGETDVARQMVKKADAVRIDEDMLGGLNAFTTTPLLIAVLVRVGDVDGALAIAEKLQKAADKEAKDMFPTNPDLAWLTWATVCTLEGKTAAVERRLERTGNARAKAILCAGVANGLLELQRQAAGEKP